MSELNQSVQNQLEQTPKGNKKYKKRPLDVVGKGVEITLWVFLVIYCISLLLPLVWLVYSSLKPYDEYILDSFALPTVWKFENYLKVFEIFKVPYTDKVGNEVIYGIDAMAMYSIVWTFARSFIHVLLASMCAYVLAKFKFFGSKFIYALGIFVMIVPIVGSMPSAMLIRSKLGTYNNMLLMLLTSESTAFSGLHFLLLYAAFKRVPSTYGEAVQIDGGGNYTIFFRVVLPMVVPSMVAVFVLQFLATWTDYNTFIIWMPSYPSLSVGMYLFEQSASKGGDSVEMPIVLATFVVVIIPTTILYLATQKILMSKFTVGGIKG